MSIVTTAARHAAIALCFAGTASILPGSTALGATSLPEPTLRTPLALPPLELEPDYPAITLPEPVVREPATQATLADMVSAHAVHDVESEELRCLATAVYFESKGEPLAGQLAVAHVVLNRAQSGRFASTICGVVKQPSQFSFVRRGSFPAIGNATQWRKAVGVAQVAMKGLHKSPVPDALFFHAKRVSPGWGKARVASVGNHIFYR